jgi:hypothetical protein
MRIIAIAAALALAAATAQAQQAEPQAAQPQPSEQQPPEQQASQQEFKPIIGSTVRTQAGNELGKISDVVMHQGQLAAVIDVGEDLAAMGVDKDRIALDWDTLSPAPTGEELVAGLTMDELAAAPEFMGEQTSPTTPQAD